MKKIAWVAPVLLALGAAPAFAADLPAKVYTKAPPVIAPVYSWAGFYIGANGGGGWARDCRTNTTLAVGLGCYDATGGTAGGQVGYRWQATNWVFGLEAQGNWADISGNTQNIFDPANHIGSKLDAFGLFTGHVGYAWNNVLLYAKGGAAVVDQKFDFISNATGIVGATTGYNTRWGGTVGAGIEIGFAPHWSVAFEYDHIFLEKRNGPFTFTATGLATPSSYSTGGDVDLATVRVNYTFGGPIVAKY